jgi:16S rRNA C967 or C1407 C5-methylase (RsmB/RsmF family)
MRDDRFYVDRDAINRVSTDFIKMDKAEQIAEMMKNEGLLVAVDTEPRRLASLRNNLERLGVTNTILFKKDARFIPDFKKTFDKILLDAPCSGNFCIEANFFSTKTLDGIRSRARLQKELLKSAYRVLNIDGTLVYSTCSLEPEENELVIDWFIKRFPDMKLVDTGLDIADAGLTKVFNDELDSSLSKTKRFWPHKTNTQGFFIAKLLKQN